MWRGLKLRSFSCAMYSIISRKRYTSRLSKVLQYLRPVSALRLASSASSSSVETADKNKFDWVILDNVYVKSWLAFFFIHIKVRHLPVVGIQHALQGIEHWFYRAVDVPVAPYRYYQPQSYRLMSERHHLILTHPVLELHLERFTPFLCVSGQVGSDAVSKRHTAPLLVSGRRQVWCFKGLGHTVSRLPISHRGAGEQW